MGLAFGHTTEPWQCFAHRVFYNLCYVAYNFDGMLPAGYTVLDWHAAYVHSHSHSCCGMELLLTVTAYVSSTCDDVSLFNVRHVVK